MHSVAIFCGATLGNDPKLVESARTMCQGLAEMGLNLIYGGGLDGLMREAANIFLEEGRDVIGIRPEHLIPKEPPDPRISKMMIVRDMFQRKLMMMELADLFVALPGGAGTLDEILEIYTHRKLQYIDKICAVLNVDEFYQPLADQMNHMVSKGFLTQESNKLLLFEPGVDPLLTSIKAQLNLPRVIDKVAMITISNHQVLVVKEEGKSHFFIPGQKKQGAHSDIETLHQLGEEQSITLQGDSVTYAGTFRGLAHGGCSDKVIQLTCYYAQYEGQISPKNNIQETKWINFEQRELVGQTDRKVLDWLLQHQLIK